MELLFFSIIGLIFGSFLNCAIWRLKVAPSILGRRSICPQCRHKLAARDLWPILSWLVQKGKCRYCEKNISWQYPAVELAVAILFVLAYLDWGWSWQLLAGLIFILILVFIFVYDLKYYLILDIISLPAIVIALAANILLGHNILNLILAGLIGGGFFLFQFLISQGKWIGGGDIRLGVLLGIILGWPLVLIALIIAYLSGAIVSLALLLTKKKKLNSEMPLGVFLSAAAILCLFWGPEILAWYLRLISG